MGYINQKGFSIVELMVALVLGLIVSSAAVQIFASNKATYRLEESLSRLQENGRFVVDTIVRDVRMAGYTGCSSRGESLTINVIADDPLPFSIDGTEAIRGFNGGTSNWTPNISTTNLNLMGVHSGTDVINIQRAADCGAHVTGNWTPSNANVDVTSPNSCSFQKDEVVMVTNCTTADVFQITSNPTTGSSAENLAHGNSNNSGNRIGTYGPDSQVFKMQANAYYIATGASGEPALFRSSWNPSGDAAISAVDFTTAEIADGVEDMQILYGEDTGGDQYADIYVTANNVTDWEDVRSVRINLLLRSDDNVTSQPRDFLFNGASVNPSGAGQDRRLRMAYSSTVSVRNRLP